MANNEGTTIELTQQQKDWRREHPVGSFHFKADQVSGELALGQAAEYQELPTPDEEQI